MERLIALHDPELVGDRLQHGLDPRAAASARALCDPVRRHGSGHQAGRSATRSGLITVLATPGTVARDYTRDLIDTYAAGCKVNLVGSTRLAGFAEAELAGDPVADEDLIAELAPCFIADEAGSHRRGGACLHPLPAPAPAPEALAPWPVTWIDPAPAIARRVVQLLGGPVVGHEAGEDEALAVFTDGGGIERCSPRGLARGRLAGDRRRDDAARAGVGGSGSR